MPNPNTILNNKTLVDFVNSLKIEESQKKELLEKIPQMDEEERKSLLEVLRQILVLDIGEEKALEKIKKCWQS